MNIYTPTELIEVMEERLAAGHYRADQSLIVTIWDRHDAPAGVSEGAWAKFLAALTADDREAFDNAQLRLLGTIVAGGEEEMVGPVLERKVGSAA